MNKRTNWLLFIISLVIFLTLLFLILTMPGRVTVFDSGIRNWVNQFHSPVNNAFWRQCTSLFNAQASFFWACGVSLVAFLSRNLRFACGSPLGYLVAYSSTT